MDYGQMRPLAAILLIFLIVLAILWFLLPFAIFGTKDKLSELIAETKANTDAIKALNESVLKNKNND